MGRMVRNCCSPLSRRNGIVTLAVGLRQFSRAFRTPTGASLDMSALVSVGLKCHNMRWRDPQQAVQSPESIMYADAFPSTHE